MTMKEFDEVYSLFSKPPEFLISDELTSKGTNIDILRVGLRDHFLDTMRRRLTKEELLVLLKSIVRYMKERKPYYRDWKDDKGRVLYDGDSNEVYKRLLVVSVLMENGDEFIRLE